MIRLDCAIILLKLLLDEVPVTSGQIEAVAQAIMGLGRSEGDGAE